jgi:integrase
MEEHAREIAMSAEERRRAEEAAFTLRELSRQWLSWLTDVRGAKPSTVADYAFLLREPGEAHRRGKGTSPGRIMAAFGDRRAAEITPREVSDFLRSLDAEGLNARNVNKHRQVLAAMFSYACREDAFNLPTNPVTATDKRREDPPPALDYYEVEEVEALARCCERGEHRTSRRILDPAERAARAAENRHDAEAFRILFYTGLRLGEVLTLRWDDVNIGDRLLLVRRGLSAGEETLPKGRRHRFVPLSTPATEALARLASRDEYVERDDYVLANRLGRRLDGSALRRRYKRACSAADLQPHRPDLRRGVRP